MIKKCRPASKKGYAFFRRPNKFYDHGPNTKSQRWDLNPQPSHYECDALPIEATLASSTRQKLDWPRKTLETPSFVLRSPSHRAKTRNSPRKYAGIPRIVKRRRNGSVDTIPHRGVWDTPEFAPLTVFFYRAPAWGVSLFRGPSPF